MLEIPDADGMHGTEWIFGWHYQDAYIILCEEGFAHQAVWYACMKLANMSKPAALLACGPS